MPSNRALHALAIAAVAAVAVPAHAGDLSEKDEAALRRLLRDALRDAAVLSRPEAQSLVTDLSTRCELSALAAAVRKGPLLTAPDAAPRKHGGATETFEVVEGVTTGPSFEHEGRRYGYCVAVPKGYDPGHAYGVLLDPGHGTGAKLDQAGKAGMAGMYVRLAREAGLDDFLVVRTEILEQVGADGARGALPEERVTPIFEACLRDLATRWHVDPDRMLVSGLSQTGFWAWELGAARPDRWLGIAPMSAVTWHVERRLDNLRTTRSWVLHGSDDPTCPVAQPRATCARLERAGAHADYVEIEGGRHTYDVWKNLPAGLRALTGATRERWPREVSFAVQTLAQPWCHWLRLEAIEGEGDGAAGHATTAGIDGELDGNTVRLYSTGVLRVSLRFSAARTDFGKPVTVLWNGKRVHEGVVKPSLATLLATAVEKCDWTATYEAVLPLDAPR